MMLSIKKFTFNPFQTNTFIVYGEDKKCIIIDAACYSQEENSELEDFIEQNNLIVTMLVNTHCHVDHIFGNPYFKEKYKAEIVAHKDDEFLIASAKVHALTFGLSIKQVSPIDRYLKENDRIKIGHSVLRVIHIPGHSPGGISLYSESSKFLIAGDILFEGSIGRTDLPGGNYEKLITGIKTKLMVLPEETIVYAGHGNETTIGREKRNNPFLV